MFNRSGHCQGGADLLSENLFDCTVDNANKLVKTESVYTS